MDRPSDSSSDAVTVIARAPLRISLVGGGTDFPHWFDEHGGAVLSTTIDHYAEVTVHLRADERISIRSIDFGHLVAYEVDARPVYDGVMDLPKAALARIGVRRGLDVDIRSDAPPGSGLGGSSALVTAVVAALAAFDGRSMTANELARTSYAIERDDLGIAGGWQDHYATAFGGINLLEFATDGVRVTPARVDGGVLDELGANLMLCYTGRARTNTGLIDAQVRLYAEGREETIQGMKQLQALAYEMRDALEHGDVEAIGPMLQQAYESKKRMNPHIAEGTPIEELFAAARRAGASGGKICGAGGGGYLLLACAPERQDSVTTALEGLGGRFVPFAFEHAGVRAHVSARPWEPAR
jgi:D-glycero-alpha-D-manno-heptose-7-phosphate kinase